MQRIDPSLFNPQIGNAIVQSGRRSPRQRSHPPSTLHQVSGKLDWRRKTRISEIGVQPAFVEARSDTIEVPVETHVEFRSDRFPAYHGEEEQINPGLWGKRLAEFLRDNLRKEGFETKEPIAEDWGWVVPVANDQFSLWIGCGHAQEYPDGFRCFIEPHTPFVRKLLRKIDTRARVSSLQRALDKILSDADDIREKRWRTNDEFMDAHRSDSDRCLR